MVVVWWADRAVDLVVVVGALVEMVAPAAALAMAEEVVEEVAVGETRRQTLDSVGQISESIAMLLPKQILVLTRLLPQLVPMDPMMNTPIAKCRFRGRGLKLLCPVQVERSYLEEVVEVAVWTRAVCSAASGLVEVGTASCCCQRQIRCCCSSGLFSHSFE